MKKSNLFLAILVIFLGINLQQTKADNANQTRRDTIESITIDHDYATTTQSLKSSEVPKYSPLELLMYSIDTLRDTKKKVIFSSYFPTLRPNYTEKTTTLVYFNSVSRKVEKKTIVERIYSEQRIYMAESFMTLAVCLSCVILPIFGLFFRIPRFLPKQKHKALREIQISAGKGAAVIIPIFLALIIECIITSIVHLPFPDFYLVAAVSIVVTVLHIGIFIFNRRKKIFKKNFSFQPQN